MKTSEFDDAKETNGDLVQGPLPAGTVAPNFTLYATPDQQLSLRELKGNPVVLAFYPTDWTSVCGDQLTLYNQLLPTFREYGERILTSPKFKPPSMAGYEAA